MNRSIPPRTRFQRLLSQSKFLAADKMGARSPMGMDELTNYKWLGRGIGQVRG